MSQNYREGELSQTLRIPCERIRVRYGCLVPKTARPRPLLWRSLPMALPISSPASTLDYPDTDGMPMAESEFQLLPLLYAVAALRAHS